MATVVTQLATVNGEVEQGVKDFACQKRRRDAEGHPRHHHRSGDLALSSSTSGGAQGGGGGAPPIFDPFPCNAHIVNAQMSHSRRGHGTRCNHRFTAMG